MKKIVKLTESELTNFIKKIINEMDENIKYNYFKIIDKDGEVVGVGAAERGSKNETEIIDQIFNYGYTPVRISKKEYEDYDEGDEIRNF